MSIPEPVIELARAWWERAAEDLEAARVARHLPTACCFHCQQAVEKAVKSLLVCHQEEFEKSHDVGLLLELLRRTPSAPPDAVAAGVDELTRFAVTTRYPPATATSAEAADALSKAERFLLWVGRQLPKEL
jgi:HEPN domain-containing protein